MASPKKTRKLKATVAAAATPKIKAPIKTRKLQRVPARLKVEEVPRGEAKLIKEVAAMTGMLQDRRRAAQAGEALRGVHPKSHGCLIARFTVNPKLRLRHRVGLFARPGQTFKAKIRYSNAAVNIAPDMAGGQNGSRGMAVKVMDVGRRALVKDQGQVNQDFLLINTPEFAFADVADYHRATQALMLDPNGVDGAAYFLPAKLLQLGLMDMSGKLLPAKGEEPPEIAGLRATFEALKAQKDVPIFRNFGAKQMAGTLKSAAVLGKILAMPVRNPLEVAYWTAAPIRFGSRRLARIMIVPLDGPVPQAPITPEEAEMLGPDYLANAVAKSMGTGAAITLRVRAQILHPSELEGRTELVEDATLAWDEDEFQPVDLAKITIDPSDQPAELVDACKKDRFTPWHSLPAHEPLGGINRLRKPVYEGSADLRLK